MSLATHHADRSLSALRQLLALSPDWTLARDTEARMEALRQSMRPDAGPVSPRAFDRECEGISFLFVTMYRVAEPQSEAPTLNLTIEALEAFEEAYRAFAGQSIHVMLGNEPDDLREDDAEWAREMAVEAGMLHGIGAYNDMMGR